MPGCVTRQVRCRSGTEGHVPPIAADRRLIAGAIRIASSVAAGEPPRDVRLRIAEVDVSHPVLVRRLSDTSGRVRARQVRSGHEDDESAVGTDGGRYALAALSIPRARHIETYRQRRGQPNQVDTNKFRDESPASAPRSLADDSNTMVAPSPLIAGLWLGRSRAVPRTRCHQPGGTGLWQSLEILRRRRTETACS